MKNFIVALVFFPLIAMGIDAGPTEQPPSTCCWYCYDDSDEIDGETIPLKTEERLPEGFSSQCGFFMWGIEMGCYFCFTCSGTCGD